MRLHFSTTARAYFALHCIRPWCYEEDSGDDNEIDRTDLGTKTWCKCGKCVSMPTTTECLCCHELESAHLFDLGIYIQYVLVSFNYIKVYLSSLVFCVVASGLIKDEDCLRCDECHIVFYRWKQMHHWTWTFSPNCFVKRSALDSPSRKCTIEKLVVYLLEIMWQQGKCNIFIT